MRAKTDRSTVCAQEDLAKTMTQAIKVMLIDEQHLLRRSVAQIISQHPHLEVVSESSTLHEGLFLAKRNQPGILMLNFDMHGVAWAKSIDLFRALVPNIRIIFLVDSEIEDELATLNLGADGYLSKDVAPEDFGNIVVEFGLKANDSRRGLRLLHKECYPDIEILPDESALTLREHEIMELIAIGLSNRAISERLDIKESTVKVHTRNLLRKLNKHSRLEALALMHQKLVEA